MPRKSVNFNMTYDEAKLYQKQLYAINDEHSDKLKEFDKYGKSAMGLTPDHVRDMPEWKRANREFDLSFAKLREFNGWYVKTFKKEILADRRKKYSKYVQ